MPIVAHSAPTIEALKTLITGVTGQDGSYLAELLARGSGQLIGTIDPHGNSG